MLRFVLLFSLIICPLVICRRRQHKTKDVTVSGEDLGDNLVTSLRNDANIDLSADEEYEDLRAELLAYHTALASITNGRRSMKTTPCWKLGGICINNKMCEGRQSLTQVAGCRDRLEVCCFTWNKFQLKDMSDKGVGPPMPWSQSQVFGGKGVVDPPEPIMKKKKKKMKLQLKVKSDSDEYDGAQDILKDIEKLPLEPVVVILRHKKKT